MSFTFVVSFVFLAIPCLVRRFPLYFCSFPYEKFNNRLFSFAHHFFSFKLCCVRSPSWMRGVGEGGGLKEAEHKHERCIGFNTMCVCVEMQKSILSSSPPFNNVNHLKGWTILVSTFDDLKVKGVMFCEYKNC